MSMLKTENGVITTGTNMQDSINILQGRLRWMMSDRVRRALSFIIKTSAYLVRRFVDAEDLDLLLNISREKRLEIEKKLDMIEDQSVAMALKLKDAYDVLLKIVNNNKLINTEDEEVDDE